MSTYEYLYVDIFGDPGSQVAPEPSDRPKLGDGIALGEGRKGYIAKLNQYGAQGWQIASLDVDNLAHIRAVLMREII